MAAPPDALLLAGDALVIPGEHVLHVVARRGAFDVRGTDVHRLHERLGPFLLGSHTEAQLLAGAEGPHAAAVGAYLAALRDAGALREVAPGAEEGEPGARVSLAGPPPASVPRGTVHVCFATAREAGRLLLSPRRRVRGRLDCVVDEGGDLTGSGVARRGAYARWLLRNAVDVPGPEGRLRVFRLGADGALTRLAESAPGAPHAVPAQLGLVRFVEVDQVPLVVARAAHPLFPADVVACGLDYPAVGDHLLRAFVLRAIGLGGGEDREDGPIFAPTLPELRALLLERAARGGGDEGAEAVDLLALPGDHAAVRYLRDILRPRLGVLPGVAARGPGGVFRFRCGSRRAASLVREKALTDLLLAAALDAFHPSLRGRPVLLATRHRDFASAEALRRRSRLAAAEVGAPEGAARRVRRWGISAWVAGPAPRNGEGG